MLFCSLLYFLFLFIFCQPKAKMLNIDSMSRLVRRLSRQMCVCFISLYIQFCVNTNTQINIQRNQLSMWCVVKFAFQFFIACIWLLAEHESESAKLFARRKRIKQLTPTKPNQNEYAIPHKRWKMCKIYALFVSQFRVCVIFHMNNALRITLLHHTSTHTRITSHKQ